MFRYASFFTGAMGLDLGLEHAGWSCAFANEWDRIAVQTAHLNRPDLNLLAGDIREISVQEVRKRTGNIDLVVGGPPCQAFSTAGKRLGINDERGNVFLHFLELATALEPSLIAIENVRGLLSAPLVHRPHAERGFGFAPLSVAELRGGALSHILSFLRERGYETSFDLYDSANFGVPQRRERVILIASRSGKPARLAPTTKQSEWVTVAEAFKGLPESQEFLQLREKQLKYVKHLGPGENWRNLPVALQREAMGNAYECSGGRTGFFRRLAWNQPSPTLVTSPTMPATLLAHPVKDRPLSVQEYMRIQTFPDNWKLVGSTAQKYRQLGNAVPVRFAKQIGLHLIKLLQGIEETERTRSANSRYKNTDDHSWEPASESQ